MKTKQWILFSLITLSNYSWTDGNQPPPADWKKFCTTYAQYIPAIVTALTLGALTGGLTKFFDNQFTKDFGFMCIIFSWTCELGIRETSIQSLQHNMESCNIPNPENLWRYSQAASWIAYLGYPYLLSRINGKNDNK